MRKLSIDVPVFILIFILKIDVTVLPQKKTNDIKEIDRNKVRACMRKLGIILDYQFVINCSIFQLWTYKQSSKTNFYKKLKVWTNQINN